MFFYKLDQIFDTNVKVEVGDIYYYVGTCDPRKDPDNFTGVFYRKILSNCDTFFRFLPKDSWSDWEVSYMEVFNDTLPHIDNNIKSKINFYLQTDDCVTQYWEPNKLELDTLKLSTQTKGKIFNHKDLKLVDSFKANDGDIYLLDVTKIHCVVVSSKENKMHRKVISVHSTIPFDQAKSLLIE